MSEVIDTPTAIVQVFDNPGLALIQTDHFEKIYAELKREAAATKIDLSTEKGRKAISSLAHKVARTKTAIDDAGKALNEEARAKINLVDAARRDIRSRLDALKDEVRKPLTDWEKAEAAREERVESGIRFLRNAAVVNFDDMAETIRTRLTECRSLEIGDDYVGVMKDVAEQARALSINALESAAARIAKEESDRAELDRMRAAAAEREAQDAARIAAERAARDEAEARAAADARTAKAEADRKAQIERAAESARAEAVAAAETERKRVADAHAAEIARRDKDAADIEAARVAAERAAAAETKRIADEEAARAKNRAHRSAIMGEVKAAIMTCGVDEVVAKSIVLAIVGGNVPHTTIKF